LLAQLSWKEKLEKFDLIGTAFLIPAIVCLLLALQWGGSKYLWSDVIIVVLFTAFGVSTLVFIGVQFWKKENGTLPPRVISQRSIAAGALFSLCFGASFFSLIYYVGSQFS
jgi:hypothetical protein